MVRITRDLVSSIPADVAREAGIDIVTLYVNRDGTEYADASMDLDVFYADIYDMVDDIPTSSQPSQHTLEELFEASAKAGRRCWASSSPPACREPSTARCGPHAR